MRVSIQSAVLLVITLIGEAVAEVSLPAIFSDHMVIQRDQPVRIWGWADAGEPVEGKLGTQAFSATADAQGEWSTNIEAMPAAGPLTLMVKGKENEIEIEDVYVGEVWLCSGQSNMAMTVNGVRDAQTEVSDANFPRIRMFEESSLHARTPQKKCEGAWLVCSPDTVKSFSATAYFFGRELHREQRVPIGLINSSVGGTSIESWTSWDAQSTFEAIQPRIDAWKQDDEDFDAEKAQSQYQSALQRWEQARDVAKVDKKRIPRKPRQPVRPRENRNYPANLFNGKISPLVGYTIRGAIWYQGESSSGRGFAHLYGVQLETLINDWRSRWGQGDFPFAWVQLPNFRAPQRMPSETSGWVLVQEGMRKTLDRTKNTGMAITIDIGQANNIHPRNKQDVGKRLALWALGDVYGQDNETSGPLMDSWTREGNRIIVQFTHATRGLESRDGEPKGFAIAGKDRQFHWAKAKIDGNRVIVWSEEVPDLVSVRYAWSANPNCNLYNRDGIPASPFRTDDWDESGNQ